MPPTDLNFTMKLFRHYQLGDISLNYWLSPNQEVAMSILPHHKKDHVVSKREDIHDDPTIIPLRETFGSDFPADVFDPMVQLKVRGDVDAGSFSAGTTMRNSPSSYGLKWKGQEEIQEGQATVIITTLEDERGLQARHIVRHDSPQAPYLRVKTELTNHGDHELTIDMLSSFSLTDISPFQSDQADETYFAHRYQSFWSAEGRHWRQSIEELGLERSWCGHAVKNLRFGQTGSMPVKEFFPFLAIEDSKAGVFWGARISAPGSWQCELSRRGDGLNMSGGLADRERGHWSKKLAVSEVFCSPEATLSTCEGSLEQLMDQMLDAQAFFNPSLPSSETELPIIFNEWCTSWGQPSEENMLKLAHALQGSKVKYLVMDDGWFNDKAGCQQGIGDWNVAHSIYPSGFGNMCLRLRELGFIPGIWYEFESVTAGSDIYHQTEHLLSCDGHVLQKGARRFLDFRDPWVHDYLHEKVIKNIKDHHIGYLKIDYNDTIGLGCDGAESLGEGLREHLEGVQAFMRRLREELPELVIEICSSGGHRLEPSFMELGSMGGFSDSHEGLDIPIIAFNTATHIQARHNQVWAVLRKHDDEARLRYSLAATFAGRMCLSGDIHDLNHEQMTIVNEAQDFYQKAHDIISSGVNRRELVGVKAYLKPKGYQIVVRYSKDAQRAMIVAHSFSQSPKEIRCYLEGNWSICSSFSSQHISHQIQGSEYICREHGDSQGWVLLLVREPTA
jgi:alpha-galactosidase